MCDPSSGAKSFTKHGPKVCTAPTSKRYLGFFFFFSYLRGKLTYPVLRDISNDEKRAQLERK